MRVQSRVEGWGRQRSYEVFTKGPRENRWSLSNAGKDRAEVLSLLRAWSLQVMILISSSILELSAAIVVNISLLVVLGILLEGGREELVSDTQFKKNKKMQKPTINSNSSIV